MRDLNNEVNKTLKAAQDAIEGSKPNRFRIKGDLQDGMDVILNEFEERPNFSSTREDIRDVCYSFVDKMMLLRGHSNDMEMDLVKDAVRKHIIVKICNYVGGILIGISGLLFVASEGIKNYNDEFKQNIPMIQILSGTALALGIAVITTAKMINPENFLDNACSKIQNHILEIKDPVVLNRG